MKKLVIFGLRDFAEIAFEYFSFDSDYEVVAFAANRNYINSKEKFGLPIIPFEDIANVLDPREHFFYAAITYQMMNKERSRILSEAKSLGFTPASYISSKTFIWQNVEVGEHCFIFENNTIQPFSIIGDNSVLWSGNHVGHHAYIGNNVFISSQVVLSGHTSIGSNCFLGVNATVNNGVKIGEYCWINANSLVAADIPNLHFVKQGESPIQPLDMERLYLGLSRKSIY